MSEEDTLRAHFPHTENCTGPDFKKVKAVFQITDWGWTKRVRQETREFLCCIGCGVEKLIGKSN